MKILSKLIWGCFAKEERVEIISRDDLKYLKEDMGCLGEFLRPYQSAKTVKYLTQKMPNDQYSFFEISVFYMIRHIIEAKKRGENPEVSEALREYAEGFLAVLKCVSNHSEIDDTFFIDSFSKAHQAFNNNPDPLGPAHQSALFYMCLIVDLNRASEDSKPLKMPESGDSRSIDLFQMPLEKVGMVGHRKAPSALTPHEQICGYDPKRDLSGDTEVIEAEV